MPEQQADFLQRGTAPLQRGEEMGKLCTTHDFSEMFAQVEWERIDELLCGCIV